MKTMIINVYNFLNYPWFKAPTAAEIGAYQDSISDPSVKAPKDISGIVLFTPVFLLVALGLLAAVL